MRLVLTVIGSFCIQTTAVILMILWFDYRLK